MGDITSAIGLVGGVIAILTAVSSLIYLRKQTLLMATQVDKEIEIKLTKDWDAPEGAPDSKLRALLNRRLGEVRTQMRHEIAQSHGEIMRMLADSHIPERKDIAEDALRLLSDQKDAVEGFKESSAKVSALEHEIQALQQTVEGIRQGVGNQAMVRAQIRGIAEHLLRMTGQEMMGQE